MTQQQIASFEIGRRRIPVSTLPLLAKALDTSIEDLTGGDAKRNTKRGPAPKIQQQLERVSQLPRARQRMVSEVLDSLLAQARRRQHNRQNEQGPQCGPCCSTAPRDMLSPRPCTQRPSRKLCTASA